MYMRKLFERSADVWQEESFDKIAASLGFECGIIYNGEDWASPSILGELDIDQQEAMCCRWATEFTPEPGWLLAAIWVNDNAEMVAAAVRPMDAFAQGLWDYAESWEENRS